MSIKDLIAIVILDYKNQLKLLYIVVLLAACIAPGVLLLILEGLADHLYQSTFVTLGMCFVVSIPFLFLGTVVYLHPEQTLVELSRKDATEVKWNVLFGSCLWAIISASISYLTVNSGTDLLNQLVSDKRAVQYIVVWLFQFGVFGTIFYFNSGRSLNV